MNMSFLQSEENERFLGVLLRASCSTRYVSAVMVPVVVLSGKNKGR